MRGSVSATSTGSSSTLRLLDLARSKALVGPVASFDSADGTAQQFTAVVLRRPD